MLASRQVLGSIARSRAVGGAASSVRRLATVSDSALDRKVIELPYVSWRASKDLASFELAALTLFFLTGPSE
jgi:hypothetical protein